MLYKLSSFTDSDYPFGIFKLFLHTCVWKELYFKLSSIHLKIEGNVLSSLTVKSMRCLLFNYRWHMYVGSFYCRCVFRYGDGISHHTIRQIEDKQIKAYIHLFLKRISNGGIQRLFYYAALALVWTKCFLSRSENDDSDLPNSIQYLYKELCRMSEKQCFFLLFSESYEINIHLLPL